MNHIYYFVGWMICFLTTIGLASIGADSPILITLIISGWGFMMKFILKTPESEKNHKNEADGQ